MRQRERSKVENNFRMAREFLSDGDEIQFASRSSVTSESKEVHPEPKITAFIREKDSSNVLKFTNLC